jgi:hypothetical protein
MRSKFLTILAVVVLIALVGWGIGLWAGHSSSSVPPGSTVFAANSDSGGTQAVGGHSADPHPAPTQDFQPMAPITDAPVVQTNPIAQVSTNPPANTNWEDTVDDIVGSDDPDTNKVAKLFALFTNLPPDGQEEVVQHLSNLVEDDNYAQLGQLLTNSSLPQGVLDELMSDVLNRPNTLKLPMLLDVAQNQDNPEHDEAKDLLELYLGDDPSTNGWGGAGDMVTNWLKQNPD